MFNDAKILKKQFKFEDMAKNINTHIQMPEFKIDAVFYKIIAKNIIELVYKGWDIGAEGNIFPEIKRNDEKI